MSILRTCTIFGFAALLSGCAFVNAIVDGDTDKLAELSVEGGLRAYEAGSEQSEFEAQNMSPENRYYVGRGVAASIFNAYPMVEPSRKTKAHLRYINSIGQYLVLVAGMPAQYQGYTFGIIETDEPAAFSTPGGYIWIGTGMIEMCDDEDELAAVMAHEIGHAKNLHAIRQYDASREGKVWGKSIVAFFGEDDPGMMAIQMIDDFTGFSGELADAIINNDYSEEFEFEADREATDILGASGYDVGGLVRILHKVKKLVDDGEDVGAYLEGHPAPATRIEKVKKRIQTQGFKGETTAQRRSRFESVFAQ